MADTFTVLGRVVLTREPGQGPDREPRCRVHIGFDVAFHKVSKLLKLFLAGVQCLFFLSELTDSQVVVYTAVANLAK